MATMDVPQKKKGEISKSPDPSCDAKVGGGIACSAASASSGLLLLSPVVGWPANKSQNTCDLSQVANAVTKHGCCDLCPLATRVCLQVHDGRSHCIPDNILSLSVPDLPLHTQELCPRNLNNDGPCRREKASRQKLVVRYLSLVGVRIEQQELRTSTAWRGAVAKSTRAPQDHRMRSCQYRAGSALARCDVRMHNFVQQHPGRLSVSECIHRFAERGLIIQQLHTPALP